MKNLTPKLRDLITAVLTAVIMFLAGCTANVTGEKLDAGIQIMNPVDALPQELNKENY